MRIVALLVGQTEHGLLEERERFIDERCFSFGHALRLERERRRASISVTSLSYIGFRESFAAG